MALNAIHFPITLQKKQKIKPPGFKSRFILHLSDKVSIFQSVYSTRNQEGQLDVLDCIIANSYPEIDS